MKAMLYPRLLHDSVKIKGLQEIATWEKELNLPLLRSTQGKEKV
jgi:hypothetical protein